MGLSFTASSVLTMHFSFQLNKYETSFIKLIDLQGRIGDSQLETELEPYDHFYLVTPYQHNYLNQLIGSRSVYLLARYKSSLSSQ